MRKLGIFVFLVYLSIPAITEAKNYCYNNYQQNYGYQQNYSNDTGIVFRADGTYWRDNIQLEKVQKLVFRNYKWYWDNAWVPMPGQKLQAFQQYSQSYAEQGSTVYGYTQLDKVWQPTNLSLAFNQAGRLAEQALVLGGSATGNLNALIQTEGSRQARVAEIVAKGQAAAQALNAVNPTGQQEKQSIQLQISDGKVTQINPQNGPITRNPDAFQALIQNKCYACHNDQKAKGNLSFDQISKFDQATWEAIQGKITHDDPTKRMPLAQDLSPGELLSVQEMKLFFQY